MKLRLPGRKKSTARQPRLMTGQDGYTFRRSRTIIGTMSETVDAAAQKEAHLKTTRLRLHELHARRRTVLMQLGLVIIVLGLLGYLTASFIGGVTRVALASGSGGVATDGYIHTIRNYLNGHPLEEFSFSLDQQALTSYVATQHTEVGAVSLTTQSGQIGFLLELRRPLLVWKTSQGKFYVDGSGVTFTTNAFAEPALSVVDNSGVKTDGSAVASGQFIRFLGQIVAAINARNIGEVTEVSIPSGTTRELDVRLSGLPYDIKTNIDRDPLQEAEDIARTVAYLKGKGITPTYIDNRVRGKAFYR